MVLVSAQASAMDCIALKQVQVLDTTMYEEVLKVQSGGKQQTVNLL